jgi:cytochrome c
MAHTPRMHNDRHPRGPAAALAALLAVLASCERQPEVPEHLLVPGGIPDIGRRLIGDFGCGACHLVPGVRGARGTVGPPLTHFGFRGYVAGTLPNRPETLVRFLRDPPSVQPQTAMPVLGVTDEEARHIAAYLYTLR